MSFMERVREKVYWALDAVQGGFVHKSYEEIKRGYYEGVSEAVVEEKMNKLFRHAVDTVPYYEFLKGREALALKDFPLMNKMEYLNHYEEVQSSLYKGAKGNVIMSTSGSTGTPFAVIQNKEKAKRNNAVSIAFNEIGGYRLGDLRAFFRVWANMTKKSGLSKKMENLLTLDATSLTDDKLLEVYHVLKNKKVKSLTGYSACLMDLSNYIKKKNLNLSEIHLNSIFSISEALDEADREQLKEQFHCPVNSFYSSMENGNMTMRGEGSYYQLDGTTWFLEILKFDKDEPAEEGELGRVVVTDFYNYAIPMIRYENGDIAKIMHKNVEGTDRRKTYLTEVYGRRLDVVYDIAGNPISPHNISVNMRDIAHVLQWKFIQTGEKEYLLQLNTNGAVDVDLIKVRFKDICGEGLSFEFVDEIPVLSSGKRKPIENLMNKKAAKKE